MANGETTSVLKRERMYEYLKNQIVVRKIKPGQRINEREFSKKLGVGRGTLREALLKLVNGGFVENVPGIGSYAKEYSFEEAKEMFYLREVLEGAAARLASEKINRIQAKELIKQVDDLAIAFSNSDASEMQKRTLDQMDISFHQKIAEISGNSQLVSMIENSLGVRVMITESPFMPEDTVEEHRVTLQSIIDGEGEKAEMLMRAHISESAHELLRQIV